jgi:HD superfamily phosphohydrolase
VGDNNDLMRKYPWGCDVDDLVLNHPLLQIQADHKQLGQVAYVRPEAKHSRYHHAGFTKYIADRICRQLEERGNLPGSRNDIVQFTKIHDISHPTFSHAVEYILKYLTGVTLKQKALQLLDSDRPDKNGRTIRDVLELSGACVNNLKDMFLGKNKTVKICSDKSIGADKIGYTIVDSETVGFYLQLPGWEDLLPFLTFIDEYGLDVRKTDKQINDGVNIACALQYLYFKMYTEVYLSPESMAYQRHLQKAIELAVRGGIISADELWEIGDDTLLSRINNGGSIKDNPLVQRAKETLSGLMVRDPYTSVVALKIAGLKKEHIEGQVTLEISKDFRNDFVNSFENPLKLTELEDMITNDMKGVPVLCCLIPDPEKVKPTDITLYEAGKKVSTLKQQSGGHYKNLEDMADEHFAICLRVPPSEKEIVRRNTDRLCTSFFEHSKSFIERDKKAA